MENETSPSRMAAQVVSGIGFLGAGAIMREGLNVKGLNTAATLWCAAAVGVACGAGFVALAALMAALIVLVNIVIRPLVALIGQAPRAGAEAERVFRITATCTAGSEAPIRLLLVKQIAASETRLLRLDTEELGGGVRVVLTAHVVATGDALGTMETIIARLSLEPAVTRAGWAEESDG
jgi:putative Mg2+ transporter-C (MgtC) family protein